MNRALRDKNWRLNNPEAYKAIKDRYRKSPKFRQWTIDNNKLRSAVLRARTLDDLFAKEGVKKRGPKPIGFLIRFRKSFVEGSKGECWNWQGTIDNTGYGRLSICNIEFLAHRLAYLVANGKLDPDLVIMHSCDNPKCVNPNHLSEGTDADNIADSVRKNRNQKGVINGMSKLEDADILQIRRLRKQGAKLNSLADRYGVWPSCISKIANRRRWRHLP